MRKTARPVVWEGDGAQSPSLHPIEYQFSGFPPKKDRPPLTNYADTLVGSIRDVADLLRGPCRPPEYRKVMLPMTVLRRLDGFLKSHDVWIEYAVEDFRRELEDLRRLGF